MHRGGSAVALGRQLAAVEVRGGRRPRAKGAGGRLRNRAGHEQICPSGTRNRCRGGREDERAGHHCQRHQTEGLLAARRGHSRKPAVPAGGRPGAWHLHHRLVRREEGQEAAAGR